MRYTSLQYCHLSCLKRDHPDYLGSASWITDADGNGYQHLQYLPPDSYRDGESWVEQRLGSYNTPYQFSGKEKDEETGYNYFGARYYDSELSVWLSVDPMSDKYPFESPFTFVANNPVLFVDPNGEEKIIAVGNQSDGDKIIHSGANNYQDDQAIHIFSHGSASDPLVTMGGETFRIHDASEFAAFLEKYSTTWKNRETNSTLVIVMDACSTGFMQSNKESFAEEISSSELFKDVTIIAPDDMDWFSPSGETGIYAPKLDSKGNVIRDEKGRKIRSDNEGSWLVFKNGVQTDQFAGNWNPKYLPSLWDRMTKQQMPDNEKPEPLTPYNE
jgi:RHS repeat-associated protein